MSCSKRLAACGPRCQHWQSVQDYRAWRESAEQERERVTKGYATETAEYGPLPTFREWLIQRRGQAA
jgi:hypothetical protein